MGKVTGSWLEGPQIDRQADGQAYPGERLGLAQTGSGSVAGFGRRIVALFADWILCLLIAAAISRRSAFDSAHPVNPLLILGVLAFEYVVLLSTIGCTIGMRLLGIGVRRIDGGRLALSWVVVRTLLLVVVVPAVVYDRDQRGLHDKAAGAIAVRL